MSDLIEALRDQSWREQLLLTKTELAVWDKTCCEAADEIERLHKKNKELQIKLDDANETLQLHQTKGDYEAGRLLSEKAAEGKIKQLREENKQLQAEKRAAVRLLREPHRITYGWLKKQNKHGRFLDGKFAGETMEDVIAAEAAKERTMTADEAIAVVKSKASLRRWEGQGPYPDEVLVAEIERLRKLTPSPNEVFYKAIEPKEGQLCSHLGVHILNWQQKWGEPEVGFIRASEVAEAAKEKSDAT